MKRFGKNGAVAKGIKELVHTERLLYEDKVVFWKFQERRPS